MSASGHGSGSDDEGELDFDFSDLPEENATPPAQATAQKLLLLRGTLTGNFRDNVGEAHVMQLEEALPNNEILNTDDDSMTLVCPDPEGRLTGADIR
ncbi:hypothetical protein B484DRAFT_407358 [Ochromonadaceae sp. CCMP2298]|nr:hypothetical protein B484DRAFT_407358 [Ochromonadaceae sp. CCMP2298]